MSAHANLDRRFDAARLDDSHWPQAWRTRWQRIAAHSFDDPDAPLDFTARLAREHGWTRAQAASAIEEYRRFAFLAVTQGIEVTPSDAVDEVWHLHLTFTRDYWQRWCRDALGAELHHGPTRGRAEDRRRYALQYAQTLAAYERCFGPPPQRWWPGTHERFRNLARFQRVDRERVWIVPRPRWRRVAAGIALLAGGVLAAPMVRAELPGNPFDWTAGPFLALYAALAVAAIVAAVLIRNLLRDNGRGGSVHGLEPLEIAYLAGGPERALDCALVDLMARNAVTLDPATKTMALTEPGTPSTLPAPLDAVARRIGRGSALDSVVAQSRELFESLGNGLRQRGLLLQPDQAARVALLSAIPLLGVLAFGVARIALGISRDKPVGFLVVMAIVVLVATLIAAFARPRRSRAGDRALGTLKTRHARAARAPTPDETALAVALVGSTVLTGTAYAHLHQLRHPPSSGSSDSSSDGGGGGGGCGGCGGGD